MDQQTTIDQRELWRNRPQRAGTLAAPEISRERRREAPSGRDVWLSRGLGAFSIGLGLAEVLAPRRMARLIGVPHSPTLFRIMGIREMASGIGILAQRKPVAGMWSRVAGDAVDMALLTSAMRSERADWGRVLLATAAVAGVTALDVQAAQSISGRRKTLFSVLMGDRTIYVRKSIRVNSSPEQAYRFWHDFQNLPKIMRHLESVELTGGRRSHWVATGPAGMRFEWDAEVIEDRQNESIAWRSLEGADVENSGVVKFQRGPGGRGAVVWVEMEYRPPAGSLGASIAKLFGEEPGQQVSDDLRRFKQIIETGEVVMSDASMTRLPRPAQPAG
jgi:uncharacterized membrane protein